MVVRGGYGIVYDPLTGIEQDWKGISNFWPAIGSGFTNAPTNQLGQPLTTVEQTFSTVGHSVTPALSLDSNQLVHGPASQGCAVATVESRNPAPDGRELSSLSRVRWQ